MNITSTLVRGSDDHYYPGELQCVFSLEEKDCYSKMEGHMKLRVLQSTLYGSIQ